MSISDQPEHLTGDLSIDPALIQLLGLRQAIEQQVRAVLDYAEKEGLPLLPLTLHFKEYVIPST